MKRFLPLIAALAFSAFAVATALFLFRPRMDSFRAAAGELRHKVDEVVADVTEPREVDK